MEESNTYRVQIAEHDVKHLARIAAQGFVSHIKPDGFLHSYYLGVLVSAASSAGMEALGNESVDNLTDLFIVLETACLNAVHCEKEKGSADF